jgi:predicted aldo/keto reductase-like oxidoreductase
MHKDNHGMKRREFVKTGLQVAAGTAVLTTGSAGAAVPENKQISLVGPLPTRILGKTGVELPILGFGGSAIVRRWGCKLTEEERIVLVRRAYDQGVRYFDTAGNYMESEPIFGEALTGIRDNVYLATKVETTDPTRVRRAVERSLGKLQTDYLDCIQIHGTPGIEDMSVSRAMEIHAELVKLRDERIARFIGLTGHHYFDKLYQLISTDGFDQCLLVCGYFRKGMVRLLDNNMLEWRAMCFAKAHELGMGIVAMKVLGRVLGHESGQLFPDYDPDALAQLPAAAIRFVLQDDRIHLLNIGMARMRDVDENVQTLAGPHEFSPKDRLLLAEYCRKLYQHPKFA